MKNGKLIACFLLFSGSLYAQAPGSLDDAFGAGGIVVENQGFSTDQCWIASGAPGNKILMAGSVIAGAGNQFAVLRLLADGTPDSSFGSGGRALFNNGGTSYAVAQQADGKIILAGFTHSGNAANADDNFAVVRLLPDGSRDLSFIIYALDDGQNLNNYATNILLQTDGKIILTGMTLYPDGRRAPTMVRLKPDGFVDYSFGNLGWANGPSVETNYSSLRQSGAVLLPGGQILIASGQRNPVTGGDDPWLLQYDSGGDPDTSFGDHGERLLAHPGNDAVYKLYRQSGSFLLGGSTATGIASDALIARLLPDGTPDSSFAGDGFREVSLGAGLDFVYDVKNGPGSQIFAAVLNTQPGPNNTNAGVLRLNNAGDSLGYSPTTFGGSSGVSARALFFPSLQTVMLAGGADAHFALARFALDGNVDSTFGGNGALLIPSSGADDQWFDVAVLPDGSSVAAGIVFQTDANRFALGRYLPDGQPDPAFGLNGLVSPDLFNGREEAYALAVQPDGRIVLGGTAWSSSQTGIRFALARFSPAGKPDSTFGNKGFTAQSMGLPGFPENASCVSVALQPDGRIVAGGSLESGGFALMRFLPDGTLDPAFGTGGKAETQFSGYYNVNLRKVLVLPDGTILAAGYGLELASDHSHFITMRYLSDGVVDTAFGDQGAAITDFGPSTSSFAASAAVLPGGSIALLGGSIDSNVTVRVALARLLPNGMPDPAHNARLYEVPGATLAFALDATPQPDGKLLLEGYASGKGFVLRLREDGQIDSTFGDAGFFILTDAANRYSAIAGALQADGKLLVAGSASDALQSDHLLFRLLTGVSVGVIDAPAAHTAPLLYPNPVRDQPLTVEYELPVGSTVQIELLDLQGRSLARLLDTVQPAGKNRETLRLPAGLVAGIYLVDIRTNRGNAVVRCAVR